jgi:hypothetical protein
MSAAPPRRIAVIIGVVDGDTRDEAFRAALGLSLRGGRIHVAVTDLHAPLGPASQRARATLELMGHVVHQPAAPAAEVAQADVVQADVVEVWGPVHPERAGAPAPASRRAPPRGTTHLVRPGRSPAFATRGEPVLHLPPVLDRDDADRLLDQLLTGDRVVVW